MKIVLDVDDVLADTFAGLEQILGPAARYDTEELAVMFPGADPSPYLHSLEFHRDLPVVAGAVAGVGWLAAAGHEIIYASARPPAMRAATVAWLEEWRFPQLPLHCLGRESKKELLATEAYDLLLDDQIRFLEVARRHGRQTIVFDYPWNAGWEGPRMMGWGDIERVLPGAES